jgi:hypothetical protein
MVRGEIREIILTSFSLSFEDTGRTETSDGIGSSTSLSAFVRIIALLLVSGVSPPLVCL